jgi:hypothetical protein
VATAFTGLFTLIASLFLVSAPAQEPKTSVREFVSVAGTVDRVDRSTRMLTLRGDQGILQSVYVPPEFKLFDELKAGDKVLARIRESFIVSARPGLKPQLLTDTTADAMKTRDATDPQLLQQLKAVVTIESVDSATAVVTYKTADNRRLARAVIDPKLLEGLKPGDVVEVTLTRERVVELQRR